MNEEIKYKNVNCVVGIELQLKSSYFYFQIPVQNYQQIVYERIIAAHYNKCHLKQRHLLVTIT